MKKLLYSLAFLASLLSIFSCERENKPGEPTDGKLVVSAVISDWTSAKVLPEGTAGEAGHIFHPEWKTGDKIIGYYNNGKADVLLNYEVEEVANGTATFKKIGAFEEPGNGQAVYFAYAQGCEASALANGKLAISIKNQTKRAMPVVMGAAGVVLDGKLSLSFISITSVIGIKNPTLEGTAGSNISQLTLSGSGIVAEGTLDLKTAAFTPSTEKTYITKEVDQTEGDGTILVSIFPEISSDLKLTVMQDGLEYSLLCPSLQPAVNSYYYFLSPDFQRLASYIPIDWEKDVSSKNFDVRSGNVDIVFKSEAPPFKKNDVITVPDNLGDYHIRVVSSAGPIAKGESGVSLKTIEGKMGHLFKNRRFTLSTESGVTTKSPFNYTYTPSMVEIFDGTQYVPVWGGGITKSSGNLEKEIFSWEKNMDGTALWETGPLSLSWDKCNFDIGLKGVFEFDFGEVPWEDVGVGDLQYLSVYLEGGFNMELVLKIAATASAEVSKELTLLEDIVKARYTFMVGTVPVYVTIGADLMAELAASAEGTVSVSGGVGAGMTAKMGCEWSKTGGGKAIHSLEKNLELIGPDVEAQAKVEGSIATYPEIKIGLYHVLCPTISPKPYIKAGANARLVEGGYFGWNAGLFSGIELGLELNLDLFFWEKTLVEFEPISLFELPIVTLPDGLSLKSETPAYMKVGESKEIKYHATNKNYLSGTVYNAAGMLVYFEAIGGELDKDYAYTDKNGEVSVNFTLTDDKEANVKAQIVVGDEEEEGPEADLWEVDIINFRLSATPLTQEVAEGADASITFKLEKYSSKTGEWTPVPNKTLYFTPVGGGCPPSGNTSQDGTVQVTFTPEEDFVEGSVTASYTTTDPVVWSGEIRAEITAEDEGGEGGALLSEIKKAKKMKENTLRIGGLEKDIEIVKGEHDYVSVHEDKEGVFYFDWAKEHPIYSSCNLGMIGRWTENMLGVIVDIMSPEFIQSECYVGLLNLEYHDGSDIPDEYYFATYDTNDNTRLVEGGFLINKLTNGHYTLQLYLKREDGLQVWGSLRTTSVDNPEQ